MSDAVDIHPERTLIPARTGWSQRLGEGERFVVVDLEGGQAADLWVFNAVGPEEYLSAQHTRVHMGRIHPETGWTFVTNERRPILEFVEDTSPGAHDCLVAACDPARYRLLGAAHGTPPARTTFCPSCPSMDSRSATHRSRSTSSRTSGSRPTGAWSSMMACRDRVTPPRFR